MSSCIATVEQMVDVLNKGAKDSLVRAREMGKAEIPCTVNLFRLKDPKPRAPFLQVKNLKSIPCITYVTNPRDRRDPADSGYYINVFPWISWRLGWAIPLKDVKNGDKARVLKPSELKLKGTHKPAGERDTTSTQLQTFHKNRIKILH